MQSILYRCKYTVFSISAKKHNSKSNVLFHPLKVQQSAKSLHMERNVQVSALIISMSGMSVFTKFNTCRHWFEPSMIVSAVQGHATALV